MGYISRVTGTLTITRATPTLTKPAIPTELLTQLAAYGATVQIPDQELIGLSPAALARIDNDQEGFWIDGIDEDTIHINNSGKAYDFEADFKKLAAIATADGAELHGIVKRIGEEDGDVSRVVINGSHVREEKATVVLRWADGTTETLDG